MIKLMTNQTISIFRIKNMINSIVIQSSSDKLFTLSGSIYPAIIKKMKIREQSLLNTFINESTILSLCDHPNIVKYYTSYFQGDDVYCIEMEYLRGGNLAAVSIDGDFEKLYRWIYQIGSALLFLHKRGIIHRDVKLTNIVTDQNENVVKLIDFGVSISKWLLTYQQKQIIGTPCYMAPQLFMKNFYDQKIDVYSLGVCVYQLIYNNSPFQGKNKQQYWMNSIQCQIDYGLGYCPEQVIKLMKKMLQKLPRKRASIEQILNDEIFIRRGMAAKLSKAQNQA